VDQAASNGLGLIDAAGLYSGPLSWPSSGANKVAHVKIPPWLNRASGGYAAVVGAVGLDARRAAKSESLVTWVADRPAACRQGDKASQRGMVML
jgi:hypothetical protein